MGAREGGGGAVLCRQHKTGGLSDGECEVFGAARGADAQVATLQSPAQAPAVRDCGAALTLCLLSLQANRML